MTTPDFSSSTIPRRSLKRAITSKTIVSRTMTTLAFVCTILALIPLVAVLYYVLVNGLPRLGPQVFFELPPPPRQPTSTGFAAGGFGNAVIGTFITVGLASLFSIPFGILSAIFLSEFARGTKVAEIINFLTNVLSGVPSIVMGVFAYSLIVLVTRSYSAMAAGIALAVLMLPTIVRTSTEALEAVPNELRQASVGLGATNYQTVLQVVLPAAVPAIITGVILGVARAAGETAPVIFTALFNNFWNFDVWKPTATLSVLTYNYAVTPYANWQQLAWTASLVLVAIVLLANILSRWIASRQR